MAQRIVRAKKTLSDKQIRFELPTPTSCATAWPRSSRSSTSSSTRGMPQRPARTGCGPPCARRRCGSAACSPSSRPQEPEVHGLLALMELQASRLPARIGPRAEPVLLPDQDRRRWDRLLVRRGLASPEARRGVRPAARALHGPGRDRRVSCARVERGGHRLDAHRGSLRRPRRHLAVTRRRGEPRCRRRLLVRTRRGARGHRRGRGVGASCALPATCTPCAATCSTAPDGIRKRATRSSVRPS